MREVKAGEFYRHFKGKHYQIITLAHHSETNESLVVYQALYGEYKVCARPYDMFISKVDKEKYPEATQEFRFEKVEPPFVENSGSGVGNHGEEEDSETNKLVKFLDTKSIKRKIELLDIMRNELNDNAVNAICISLDIPEVDGTLEEKYDSIRRVLETKERYERGR